MDYWIFLIPRAEFKQKQQYFPDSGKRPTFIPQTTCSQNHPRFTQGHKDTPCPKAFHFCVSRYQYDSSILGCTYCRQLYAKRVYTGFRKKIGILA